MTTTLSTLYTIYTFLTDTFYTAHWFQLYGLYSKLQRCIGQTPCSIALCC